MNERVYNKTLDRWVQLGSNGEMVVVVGGTLEATLQAAATTIGPGTEATLSGQSRTTLDVDGTATSFTLVIEGTINNTRWDTLEVVKRGSLDILQSITTKGIYVVDLAGISKVKAHLSAVAGGSVTVLAR